MEIIKVPQLSIEVLTQAEVADVQNLFWINPEKTAFNCMLIFSGTQTPQPFSCNQIEVGVLSYVTQIWNNALAGKYGPIADYTPPPEYSTEAQPNQPVVEGAMTL